MESARRGAIVPHAPLLAPSVARRRADARVERVRVAVREVARDFDRPVVVVSPHGRNTGVYLHPSADLTAFGLPRASTQVSGSEVAGSEAAVSAVANAWGRPLLEEPLDHGVVVPMLLGPLAPPVIGAAFAEDTDPTDDASDLAEALRDSPYDVIASVNTGAGLTQTAPATALEGAAGLEAELREALTADVSAVDAVARRLATAGASCSLGPLLVMGRLFAGRVATVLAHEWPFGVGYLVARVEAAG